MKMPLSIVITSLSEVCFSCICLFCACSMASDFSFDLCRGLN